MTQVSELEAGAALDARVAEILGWSNRTYSNDEHGVAVVVELWFEPDGSKTRTQPPEFSRSHEAAARIKHHLRDQGVYYEIIDFAGDGVCVQHHSRVGKSVSGESEPLALCRFLVKLDEEGVLQQSDRSES